MPQTEYGPTKPLTEEQHDKLLKWCLKAYISARDERRHREPGWEKDYRLYRSWVDKPKQDWHSRVFIPESYTAVETILPHMIAQLPGFTADPVGPEDEDGAQLYDLLFDRARNKSKLHMHLFDTLKETAIYGTGILKVFPDEIKRTDTVMEPVFVTEVQTIEEPLIDPETGLPLRDPDGNITMQEREIENQIPDGMEPKETEEVDYYGPMYKCVDLFHFFVAPDAADVESARYVIHRDYIDLDEIQKRVDEGIYQWPGSEVDPSEEFDDEGGSARHRAAQIGLASTSENDSTKRQAEVLEVWTNDGKVITLVNQKVVVRVAKNPFHHGMKPFVRFNFNRMPHEFYGVGIIETLEHLQDAINKVWNRRMDEVLLKLNPPTAVNVDLLVDRRDLQRKPGQVLRVDGDMRPQDVLMPIDLGEVNNSAYTEVDALQRMGERTTAASEVQQGISSPDVETATATAALLEQGANRFALISKLFEMDSYHDLAYMTGSLIRQFTTDDVVMILAGPEGAMSWAVITPEGLQGAFDFTIDAASTQQSETIKREQAQGLLGVVIEGFQLGLLPGEAVIQAYKDLFAAFGKDVKSYLGAMPAPAMNPMLPPVAGAPPGTPPPGEGAPALPPAAPIQGGV